VTCAVEPPPHAARVGLRGSVGGIDELEALERAGTASQTSQGSRGPSVTLNRGELPSRGARGDQPRKPILVKLNRDVDCMCCQFEQHTADTKPTHQKRHARRLTTRLKRPNKANLQEKLCPE